MIKNLGLEMSLKPFKQKDDDYIRNVCFNFFEQWRPMINGVLEVSVMLWVADGSELLEYRGIDEDEFEWCCFLGTANRTVLWDKDKDPEKKGLHSKNYLYTKNPPKFNYGDLKRIVAIIKETGKKMFPNKKIMVGETFDPGPEFAKSDFKYLRHNEACMGNSMGKRSYLCAYAKLKADDYNYAGFPNGIPDNLPFGIFLGRQCQHFLTDMGFDYIWFSNGFGFGLESWGNKGAILENGEFNYSAYEGVKGQVMEFWKLFRSECPDFPIQVRGTNMPLGIDSATDGVPFASIYSSGLNILPPPNSPWSSMHSDYGLELTGYMSKISGANGDDFMYRYYFHDPWWANSPWYDRYGSSPHDIYLPMSVSRINSDGSVGTPNHMNILSIDNSFGEMPDCCVQEVVPHLNKAIKDAPNQIAPIVWVYPYNEYSSAKSEYELHNMYYSDWFIRNVINEGAPISAVVTTDNFIKTDKSLYKGSVIVSAIPYEESEYESEILKYADNGGKVILFGSLKNAGKKILEYLEAEEGEKEISGELELYVEGEYKGVIMHRCFESSGGINTLCKEKNTRVFAKASNMAFGIERKNLLWTRGTLSTDYYSKKWLLMKQNREQYYPAEQLFMYMLGKLGYMIEFDKPNKNVENPVIMLARRDNGFFFSTYSHCTVVKTKMRFPLGMPMLIGMEAIIEDGMANYNLPKAGHFECRAFIEQKEGIVGSRELPPVSMFMRRRIEVFGLKDATIRVFGESYAAANMELILNSIPDFYFVGDDFEGEYITDEYGTYYEARHVTGKFVFSMPRKNLNG